jgi:hypothetical protein
VKPLEKAIKVLSILKYRNSALEELRNYINTYSVFITASTRRYRSDLRPPLEY